MHSSLPLAGLLAVAAFCANAMMTTELPGISPAGHPAFASLAIAGDILGCEPLLLGGYAVRFPRAATP